MALKTTFHLFLTILLLITTTRSSFATSTIVTSEDNTGMGSLRSAIIDSTTADTIYFANNVNTIMLQSQIIIDRNVVIIGNGASSTIIEGNNTRHFWIRNALKVEMHHITLTKGYYDGRGGSIFINPNKELTMKSVTVSDNSVEPGQRGGAIYFEGTLIMEDCKVINNYSPYTGGAISSIVPPSGGTSNAKLFIESCIFSANHTPGGGGAIVVFGDTVSIVNSLITGNRANSGGGLYFGSRPGTDPTNVTIYNSTIAGNRCLKENTSLGRGAGIFIWKNANLYMANTIVGTNTVNNSLNGPDVFYEDTGTFHDLGGNLISDTTDIDTSNPFVSALLGTPAAPIDPQFLISLDSVAVPSTKGDFRLTCGSSALNAGIDTTGFGLGLEDILGSPRITNGTIDIGAHERVSDVTTWIVNTIADSIIGSLRSAVNNACFGDTVVFSNSIDGQQIELEGDHLILDSSIVVIGNGIDETIISGMENSRIFEVPSNQTATIQSMTLEGGDPEQGQGGAIFSLGDLNGDYLNIRFCNATNGGGIYCSASGSLNLSNSQIVANSAKDGGGIFNNFSSQLVLKNNTIAGNDATDVGGGIYVQNGDCQMHNTIVAKNFSANDGPDIYTSSNLITDLGYNLIGDTTGIDASVILETTTQVGNSNDPLDPLFIQNPFANDGNPGSVQLKCGSPALDKGDPTSTTVDIGDFDVDGLPRIANDTVDIGAHERPISGNWLVTTVANDGSGSLREGLENVCGDTIYFDASLNTQPIILGVNQDLFIDKDVVIIGNGQDNTILDGGNNSRIFNIKAGTTSVIHSLSIQNGYTIDNSGLGGAIYNEGNVSLSHTTIKDNEAYAENGTPARGGGIFSSGILTLDSSIVSANSARGLGFAGYGGGIYNSGTLNLKNSTILDNEALLTMTPGKFASGGGLYNDGTANIINTKFLSNEAEYIAQSISSFGGGIYNRSGNLTITDSEIETSSATFGGGIYIHGGGAIISNSNINLNEAADGDGGGIYTKGDLIVNEYSSISNNKASTGGGIYNSGNSTNLIINKSLVSSNVAATQGGGINITGTTETKISNSIISGNRTNIAGGGIHLTGVGTFNITNTTITGNSVTIDNVFPLSGGGIYASGPDCVLKNSIVAKNFSGSGGDIFGTVNDLGYNLIGDTTSTNIINVDPQTLVGNSTNPLDPKFFRDAIPVDLNGLGGDAGDLRLWCDSPAINAGDPSTTNMDIGDFDVFGEPRFINTTVDMGASEYASDQIPTDIFFTTGDVINDFEVAKNIRINIGTPLMPVFFKVEQTALMEPGFEVPANAIFEILVDRCN